MNTDVYIYKSGNHQRGMSGFIKKNIQRYPHLLGRCCWQIIYKRKKLSLTVIYECKCWKDGMKILQKKLSQNIIRY